MERTICPWCRTANPDLKYFRPTDDYICDTCHDVYYDARRKIKEFEDEFNSKGAESFAPDAESRSGRNRIRKG